MAVFGNRGKGIVGLAVQEGAMRVPLSKRPAPAVNLCRTNVAPPPMVAITCIRPLS